MFSAQVPEKIIQEQTGHRSLDAVRVYQRTSTDQQKAVSSILASANSTQYFSDKLEKVVETEPKFEPKFVPKTGPDSCSSAPGPAGMKLEACQNCTINVNFYK